MPDETRPIQHGAVYWVQRHHPEDAAPQIAHPHVVIQADARTVVVCAITTNAKKISMPGSVLLAAGEANLPRRSIVEVANQITLDKTQLGDYIGQLSAPRMVQVMTGVRLVQRSFFDDR